MQGDIVLVPFPFTDLSGHKVRPAVVLSKKENGEDISVCFVSSIQSKKILPYELLIKSDSKSFKNTGLKVNSVVKVAKIATLEKKVVLGKLGELDKDSVLKIKGLLKNYFGI